VPRYSKEPAPWAHRLWLHALLRLHLDCIACLIEPLLQTRAGPFTQLQRFSTEQLASDAHRALTV